MNEWEILRRIEAAYQDILGESLVGIYVHGSIAFGCFHWETSDIDFLVVVRQSPDLAQKIALMETLLALDADCPPKGLEMSVVREEFCRRFVHPMPFELHFSDAHKEACRAEPARYCQTMNGTDADLAAHCTVLRHAGIALCGKPIEDVFGEVPARDYLDSIRRDVADAETEVGENPVYVILNLCRVLAYLREGLVLSKAQGATWGRANLPYPALIEGAAKAYAMPCRFSPDQEEAKAFARFALREIFS